MALRSGSIVAAVSDYEASGETDMPLTAGELLWLIDDADDYWAEVKSTNTTVTGFVPKELLVPVQSHEPPR